MKSGIENPSKSEVIGRCDGDEKNEWPDKSRTIKKIKKKLHPLCMKCLILSFIHNMTLCFIFPKYHNVRKPIICMSIYDTQAKQSPPPT